MTTVAYRDGILAADTLGNCNGIQRDVKKLHKIDDCILGFAGNYCDGMHFVEWWKDRSKDLNFRSFRTDGSDSPDVSVIVVFSDGLVQNWTEHLQPTPITDPFYAIGSGAKAALAAMHMGATATEAVLIASKVDLYTGPTVEAMSHVGR